MATRYLPIKFVAQGIKPLIRLATIPGLNVRSQRFLLNAFSKLQGLPGGTVVREIQLAGRPAERVTVGATERQTAVLYLHGGAYTIGSPRTHRSLAAHIAKHSGSAIFVLDYRLAPENPFPAALEDAVAAYRELIEAWGYRPENVAIAGDSAGGGLSAATTRKLIDDHNLSPNALVLIAPWVDPGDKDPRVRRDFVLDIDWIAKSSDMYLGHSDRNDPGFAPLLGNLSGMPPTLIQVGTTEILYDQVIAFAKKMQEADVQVTVQESDKLWHVAQAQASIIKEAAEAVSEIGAFLKAKARTNAEPTNAVPLPQG
ncbi:MAG: alpha/beta hydrolase [Mycobacteriaceae bacterium]